MEKGTTHRIAVIGGGAAGLTAAIAAAWYARMQEQSGKDGASVHVTLYEADERVGRSILATGNGRCNFSNACITGDKYNNASFVEEVLQTLNGLAFWNGVEGVAADEPENVVHSFFRCLGLSWREEAEGRLYPVTGKASTVLDVLRFALNLLNVELVLNTKMVSVEPPRQEGLPYTLRSEDGSFYRAEQVIVACGGKIAQTLLPTEISFIEQKPVLGALKTQSKIVKALDNIRVRCEVSLERNRTRIASEQGEVLFRKYGVSGIAIFNLSRFALPSDYAVIDFFPDKSSEELLLEFKARKAALCMLAGGNKGLGEGPDESASSSEDADLGVVSARANTQELGSIGSACSVSSAGSVNSIGSIESLSRGLLLPLVAETLCKYAGVSYCEEATEADLHKFISSVKAFALKIEGIADPKLCQVHRGGVSCDAVYAQTLECKETPGLYVVGEALDIDAACGGYNLHWAWGSGLLAGVSAVLNDF